MNADRKALELIARILNTAQVRWEGDTVINYISAVVTAALAGGSAQSSKEDRLIQIMSSLLEDVAEKPERLDRAQALAAMRVREILAAK